MSSTAASGLTQDSSLALAGALSGGPLLDAPGRGLPRADFIQRMQRTHGNRAVQRLLLGRMVAQREDAGPVSVGGGQGDAPSGGVAAPAPAKRSAGLIVDDSADDVGPGQMKKSAFLGSVRTAVHETVQQSMDDSASALLAGPVIDQWFGKYSGLDSAGLESTIQRECPGAAGAHAAADYVPQICARVKQGMADQSRRDAPSAGSDGSDHGAASDGGVMSTLGNLLFKAKVGGARERGDPWAIQAELGAGRPLDGHVRSSMETAFGESFAHVRVHSDDRAAGLTERFNARAFTIGGDIAFGAGEYAPGTLVGDALIAHELAHVAQQRGAEAGGVLSKGGPGESTLEEDADLSAVRAVVALWGGAKGALGNLAQNALPLLRSGLQLQRCNGKRKVECAHPTNPQMGLYQKDQNFGLRVIHTWRAPAGHTMDELKGCHFSEDLQFSNVANPPFTNGSGGNYPRSGQHVRLMPRTSASGDQSKMQDSHTHPRSWLTDPVIPGKYTVNQSWDYKCDCDDDWISMDKYVITYEVYKADGGALRFRTSKDGANGSAESDGAI